MPEFFQSVLQQAGGMSGWEAAAVILAIAYLLLAVRESIWCWYCAFFSTAIYIVLFWNVSLLMESALNLYYLLMALYGWYQWRYGGSHSSGVRIHLLGLRRNGLVIVAILIMTVLSGALLSRYTSAAWPYVDSFTTWGSVVTTFMVAKKILENWLYWLIIDSISMSLYIDRGLYLTAFLFMAYLVIVVFGFLKWHRQFLAENGTA